MKISFLAFSSLIATSTAVDKKLRGRDLVDRGSRTSKNNILSANEFWSFGDNGDDDDSDEKDSTDQVPQYGEKDAKQVPQYIASFNYDITDNIDTGKGRQEGSDITDNIDTGKGGQEGEEHESPPNEGEDDPMADAKEIARMAGLNLDDAVLLIKQQKDFSKLADVLQDSDEFLQTEMPTKPNGQYIIKTKGGRVPQEGLAVIERFAKYHAEAEVKIVASRLSLQDAEGRAERISNMLEEMNYSQVSYSIDGDQVDISAKKPADDKTKEIGKVSKERLAELLGSRVEDEDLMDMDLVLVDYDDEDIDEPHHTYGGRQIFGGGRQCTNAFSVISSSGVTGTSTAAHCDGMTTYNAVPPEANYALGPEMQHEGGWGDLQWHTTGHIEPAYYYSKPNTRWPVRSIATSISKGEWVCAYSRMKGERNCDRVFRTSVSVNYSCCPKMKRLVAMERNSNIGGDSGGPWSWYDKAYGIHSGSKVICNWLFFGCKRRSVWSRVNYLGPSLGVQVRTL